MNYNLCVYIMFSSLNCIKNKIRGLFHPEEFQGWGKRRKYFEGWYYKIVDEKEENIYAIIPGIAFDNKGRGHSFIQLLNGKDNTSKYYSFPINSFFANPKQLNISIESNNFALSSITLSLPELRGTLYFKDMILWPSRWYSPGIMGPFSFLPFLQCYHAIISLSHEIFGELIIKDKKVVFDKGRGYIEKDWGSSFPTGYIWLQANHFLEKRSSLVFSIANIPFLGTEFVGFICALYLKGKLLVFSTYNGSTVDKLQLENNHIIIEIVSRKYKLEIKGERSESGGTLVAPREGAMKENIKEVLGCKIEVTLREKTSNKIVFNEISKIGGLEITGRIENLLQSGLN